MLRRNDLARTESHNDTPHHERFGREPIGTTSDDHVLNQDVAFSVPFTHRVRTTGELSGDDFSVLLDVLQPGGSGPAKVLLIAERAVATSSDHVQEIASNLEDADSIRLVDHTMLLEGGETIKNDSAGVEAVLAKINDHDLDRRSYVIAVGGGAFLDAVGYAAAIAHRGIRLVRIPTTTLAQGDSGVGVKNAINYFGKKNWVGTFAVPWAVINDAALLDSLPERDFVSGFSESVKVALLKSRSEFDWLCENADGIREREMDVVTRAIAVSCKLHLRHITEGGDPFEMLEARPLDFGHWSAHKLEPITNYEIRHGEAVGIGVAIDCFYSHLKLGFPIEDVRRTCQCLQSMGMSLWHEALSPLDRLLVGLEEFRQHLGGRLTITMLRGVGDSVNVHEIDTATMAQAIEMLRREVGV
ncbi:3-dehydroquinate synthase [Rhodopirellula sp. MGV]|uniref:3-dehydroquinate synthase n=1 Tax=Rhodopirellula sp. MGV TaxID=2023130 RepID=UPI000B976C89|nr:3-dehydroquinate synthase [Rhodopirellula sp. MGV]OYP34576.1 3-dehydroquinate synthase [Rhodopirellula sp. MGV]PNY36709.1 3-dehydroquinate synthase [Rhodopirellula baltica]